MSLIPPVLAVVAATAQPSLADLRWERRVLLVSASQAADPSAIAQRREFDGIRGASDDRDLVLVEIYGDMVRGASDTAIALRRTYRLPADRFTVVLIGKDGGERRRSSGAISAAMLIGTIDAMPMRQAGRR